MSVIEGVVKRVKRVESPALRDALLRGRASAEYLRKGHIVRRRRIAAYLRSTGEPKLQIGAGPARLEGWLNSDIVSGEVYLDLTRGLALPDATFAYAFGEHVIEHLSEQSGFALCRELHRVVRPGGVVRLTTPDLRKLIELYEDRSQVASLADYGRMLEAATGKTYDEPCRVFNDCMRLWGHRYVYDEADLSGKLRAAGFSRVERLAAGESEHAPLRGIECHGSRFGVEGWLNHAEAMCLEATK